MRFVAIGPMMADPAPYPPSMNVLAKTTTAMVYTHDVWLRVHPNSFSSGSTNTLHAYSEPSARFIETPPTTTRHRFMLSPPGAYHIRRCGSGNWIIETGS